MEIFQSQAFGIALTLLAYLIGSFLYRKTRSPLMNPLMIATLLLMGYIAVTGTNLATFLTDLSGIHVFLGPLIISLAIPIAKHFELIKQNAWVIFIGSFVGAGTSILSVLWIAPLFGLDQTLILSLIPKSATTPIAVEISQNIGGIKALTVAFVVLSAVLGSVFIPFIIKRFGIKNPLIIGMGLGTTSHAVGTSKAMEINPTAGAIAGIAMVISGITTALVSLILFL